MRGPAMKRPSCQGQSPHTCLFVSSFIFCINKDLYYIICPMVESQNQLLFRYLLSTSPVEIQIDDIDIEVEIVIKISLSLIEIDKFKKQVFVREKGQIIFPVGENRKALFVCRTTGQVGPWLQKNLLEIHDHQQLLFSILKCPGVYSVIRFCSRAQRSYSSKKVSRRDLAKISPLPSWEIYSIPWCEWRMGNIRFYFTKFYFQSVLFKVPKAFWSRCL